MTVSEYRDTKAWQEALGLGPRLARLAEELPSAEQFGLAWQLRQGMVELPAAIAHDILNGADTRQPVLLHLVAAVELVERVYPALDVSGVRSAVDSVAEKLTTPEQWAELSAPPAPAPAPSEIEAEPETEELPPAPEAVVITPEEAASVPAPPVPVPPAPAPDQATITSTSVHSERVNINVQPDSGQ